MEEQDRSAGIGAGVGSTAAAGGRPRASDLGEATAADGASQEAGRGAVDTLDSVFTGIVRELGLVVSVDGGDDGVRLVVDAPETARLATLGDSVAIGGVCLTVVEVSGGRLAFDAVPETLRRTSLGRLAPGARVNVEPALRAGEPLGGHVVQGHVDGVAAVRSVGELTWFDAPADVLRYCVEKGSIAVEGCSLTIAALDDEGFAVALVPHTLEVTTLGSLAPGDPVNLEVDVLAKYVERLVASRQPLA